MGIQGLLQFLKDASEPVHVRKYKGQTVAVDTYCWLHKGAFACADKLAKGEPTDQYVSYCMKFVHMLLQNGVRPILVFDGCTLPSKKDVEKARREKRQVNLQKGKQLLREGKLSEARDCFSRSVNITSAMAHDVIKAARAEGVDCIVAPYEADSQLAYLNKNGFAQAIITEDSDLLAFGCKTVILKMDKCGNALEIDQERLGMCKQLGDVFTEEKFRYMCILSGCDYLPSIHGIGLAKASKLLKLANNPDILTVIRKIGTYLNTNITVPDEYIEGFVRANNTFLYQLVFDPVKRKLLPLNPYDADVNPDELSYAGPNIGDSAALQIALGNADVNTMQQIDDYNPDDPKVRLKQSWSSKELVHTESIWKGNYTQPLHIAYDEKKAEDKHSPRGLILPSNKKTVKRPHDGIGGGSDVDIFSQYSFSKTKKAKADQESPISPLKALSPTKILQPLEDCSNNKVSNPQPRVRNRFATLLQRRNDECASVSATGTRSRFFCKQSDLSNSSLPEPEQISRTENVNGDNGVTESNGKADVTEECNNGGTERWSPPSEDSPLPDVKASPVHTPRGCFSWSGNLAAGNARASTLSPSLLSLRRFQRATPCLEPNERVRTDHPSDRDNKDFQLHPSPQETGVASPFFEGGDSSSEELSNSLESPCRFSTKSSPPERKILPSISKFPGLHKSKSSSSGFGKKLKPTAPARASGLSSRGRTKSAQNNENKPGLQATINDMWKNFSFKKH